MRKLLSGRVVAIATAAALMLGAGTLSASAADEKPAERPVGSSLSSLLSAASLDDHQLIELSSDAGVRAGSRPAQGARPSAVRAAVGSQASSSLRAAAPVESCSSEDHGRQVCITVGGKVTGEALKAAEQDIADRAAQAAATEATAPQTLTAPQALAATQASSPVLPSWCLEHGVTNSFIIQRTAACGAFGATLTVTRKINNVTTVVGTMRMMIYRLTTTIADVSTTFSDYIEVAPTIVIGEAAGTQITGVATCGGTTCVSQGQSFPPQAPTMVGEAKGTAYYSWTPVAGGQGTGAVSWTLNFKAPTVPTVRTLNHGYGMNIRCDQAVPGSASAGCVIPDATPEIFYTAQMFPGFTHHVLSAQESGLPGSWYGGVPLHRLTDESLKKRNRDTACPSSWPRPSTLFSCDEYPFASTKEGAWTGAGGLGGRTFDWCQVPATVPVGVVGPGFSSCMINAGENSTAGSLMNSVLFVPARVIDGDAFFVSAE